MYRDEAQRAATERYGTLTKTDVSRMKYIGEYRGLFMYNDPSEKGSLQIYFLTPTNKVVFYIHLQSVRMKRKPIMPVYEVMMVGLDRLYQGSGVAVQFYREIMKRCEIIIQGGYTQTSGSRLLWAKLNLMSDVTVMVGDKETPLHEPESDMEDGELVSDEMDIYEKESRMYAFYEPKR